MEARMTWRYCEKMVENGYMKATEYENCVQFIVKPKCGVLIDGKFPKSLSEKDIIEVDLSETNKHPMGFTVIKHHLPEHDPDKMTCATFKNITSIRGFRF